MFKKLKEKITEEVKSSPQRFQQLTQSVSDKLQNSGPSTDENFFTIGEDDANMSNPNEHGFSSVTLVSPTDNRNRRNSASSMASDVSFLPRYESASMYQLQSDLDVSASELEDNASSSSQLGHLTKEQIYSAFQKSQTRYHKYRGRYTDLARHYKELERENAKMKSVLVETQDKAIRRVNELKEQCSLEQKAKAHLEAALRDELDEKNFKIQTLETKIGLLQNGNSTGVLVNIDEGNESNGTGENGNNKQELLTKYLNEARQEIENLNGKIQELKAHAIIFQSKEQEYKSKILILEKDISAFAEKEKETNIKLAQSKMELHNEISGKDTEISKMKLENEALKQQLDTLERKLKSTGGGKLENLQSQNTKLIEKVEMFSQKCNNLENDLLKVEQYKMEIKNLNETIAELKKINQSHLDMEIQTFKEELKKSLETVKVVSGENEDLTKKIEEYKTVIEKKDKEIENLKFDCTSIKKENSDFQENVETLKNDVKNLLEEKEKLAKEKGNSEKEIEKVREEAKKGLLSLEAKIKSKIEKEFLQKEEGLKNDFRKKLDEISSNQTNVKDLQLKLFELEKSEINLKQKLESFQKDLVKKQSEYVNLETNHLELIEDSTKLRNTISNLEKKLSQIESDSQNYEDKIFRLQANISTLQEELHECRHICDIKESDNVNLGQENLKLGETLARLQKKVRMFEEKRETVDLDRTECKILELKVSALEQEKQTLLQDFENERIVFEEMIRQSKDVEEKEKEISRLEDIRLKLEDEIKELTKELHNEKDDKKMLHASKLEIERDLRRLVKKLRILEEKDEAIELNGTECKLLEMKLQALEDENTRLLNSFELERKVFQEVYEKCSHQEKQLNDLGEENAIHKEEIKTIKAVNEKLNNEIKNKTADFNVLYEENLENVKKIQDLANEVTSLNNINEKLENEIKEKEEMMKALSGKIEECTETITKQANEINELLLRSKQLEEKVRTIHEENSVLVKKEKDSQNELISKLQECEKQLKEKYEEVQNMQRTIAEIEEKLNKQENASQKEINNLSNRVKELEAIENSSKLLSEDKQVIEEELKNLKIVEANFKSLEKDKAKIDKELLRLKTVEKSFNDLQVEKAKTEENLARILEEKEKLKVQVDNFKQEIRQLKVVEVNLKTTEEEKANILKQISNLQEQLKIINVDKQNCEKSLAKVKESEALNVQLKNDNEKLLKAYERLGKEIAELKVRISQLSSDNTHITEENQTLLSEIEELKIKLEYLENEKSSFDSVKSELVVEKTKLTETVENITQQLVNSEKQNLELIDMKNSRCASENDLLVIQKDFYEIKEKCDSLIIENKNLKGELGKLEEKCDNFEKIKKNFQMQISELEHQYNEVMHEKQLLEDEIQELKISPLNIQNTDSSANSKLDNLQIIKQEKAFATDSAANDQKYLQEIHVLRDKLTTYKSLDITNKSSIEFYENELLKMKSKNEKLNRKLDETLVTLNHCAELSSSTEIEYLKNVLYNYMLGKESLVLARVIAAVCKFDPQQTETVMQKEQQKQTLLGQLGLL